MFSTSFGKGYSIYQACVHINVKQKQKDQHPGICPRIDELSFAITLYCEKTRVYHCNWLVIMYDVEPLPSKTMGSLMVQANHTVDGNMLQHLSP